MLGEYRVVQCQKAFVELAEFVSIEAGWKILRRTGAIESLDPGTAEEIVDEVGRGF